MKLRESGEHFVYVHFGGPGEAWQIEDMSGFDYFDWDKGAMIALPGNMSVPGVRDGGDVNGDGYGDVLVAGANAAVVGLGSAKGSATSMPLFIAVPGANLPTALIGAFDADGDGLSDIAFPSPRAGMPMAVARGDRERVQISTEFMTRDFGAADKALGFTTGDFDGDGIADVAATVPIDARRNVCIWLGNRDKLFVPSHCVQGPIGDPSYGTRLTSGDLAAKGRDDIIVSGGEGGGGYVEFIGIEGESLLLDGMDFPGGIGSKLTTIWPGRPGKARWATTDAAGTAILVFEGRSLFQKITTIGRGGDFMKKVRSIR
jgi:hypothetical protein